MLNQILKRLNLKQLKYSSARSQVGCPFSLPFAHQHETLNIARSDKESFCSHCCKKLFPKGYQVGRCPCWHMNKAYTKARFWAKLNEAKKGDTS